MTVIEKIMVCAIAAIFIFVWVNIPTMIAYARGVRGHNLNVMLMLSGIGAILGPLWIVAWIMAFAYKPGVTRWRR